MFSPLIVYLIVFVASLTSTNAKNVATTPIMNVLAASTTTTSSDCASDCFVKAVLLSLGCDVSSTACFCARRGSLTSYMLDCGATTCAADLPSVTELLATVCTRSDALIGGNAAISTSQDVESTFSYSLRTFLPLLVPPPHPTPAIAPSTFQSSAASTAADVSRSIVLETTRVPVPASTASNNPIIPIICATLAVLLAVFLGLCVWLIYRKRSQIHALQRLKAAGSNSSLPHLHHADAAMTSVQREQGPRARSSSLNGTIWGGEVSADVEIFELDCPGAGNAGGVAAGESADTLGGKEVVLLARVARVFPRWEEVGR